MLDRCHKPTSTHWARYGGRGILVCSRWRHSFDAFVVDMGLKPLPDMSIDRIRSRGGYSLDNCRWATRYEQAINQPKMHAMWARWYRTRAAEEKRLGLMISPLRGAWDTTLVFRRDLAGWREVARFRCLDDALSYYGVSDGSTRMSVGGRPGVKGSTRPVRFSDWAAQRTAG